MLAKTFLAAATVAMALTGCGEDKNHKKIFTCVSGDRSAFVASADNMVYTSFLKNEIVSMVPFMKGDTEIWGIWSEKNLSGRMIADAQAYCVTGTMPRLQ